MAQEPSEASEASSSLTPNWWETLHSNPLSSYNTMRRWPPSHLAAANSSSDDNISIPAPSFASAASIDSSSADISGEPSENHLWSQLLLGVGGSGDLQSNHEDGESFLEVLSSKTLATEMFDPACDYLKKLESSWEFANPSAFNSLEKQLHGYNNGAGLIEHERLANLSGLVNNWSIAPPNAQIDHQIAPSTCVAPINPWMAQYSMTDISHIKHELPNSPSYPQNKMAGDYKSTDYMSYMNEIKGESQHHEIGTSESSLLRPVSTTGLGYHIGLNNSVIGLNNMFSNGGSDIPWTNTRNISDQISFSSCLSKPVTEFQACRPSIRVTDSSERKKQRCETPSSTKGSGRGSGTSEGKKKRCQESSDAHYKKAKQESSTASSLKLQAPKVKLGERITTLQQIVSPFGKTDTASVLLEGINYIRFLQEQIQLLSDPYMKSNANKDHNSWGAMERKDKTEPKLDLRSRGLCLVPISCTPQVYRESTTPDYWTPPYRGCVFR